MTREQMQAALILLGYVPVGAGKIPHIARGSQRFAHPERNVFYWGAGDVSELPFDGLREGWGLPVVEWQDVTELELRLIYTYVVERATS